MDIQTPCVSRRQFLMAGAVSAMTVTLGSLFKGRVFAADERTTATLYGFQKKWIAKLSEIKTGDSIVFLFPREDAHSLCTLYKLGVRAGGGIGPEQDIVAFSDLCTHMGGLLRGNFHLKYAVAGPCPMHLTTFDLRRHGIVVGGQATQNLPQIVLETAGDDVFATGVVGLLYGHHNNMEGRG